MDIDLLKTFLEVNRTRHFGRAADNLFLTQSAVSSRIRLLEESVGAPLFTRTRNDIQLTPLGSRLFKYAESIVTTWTRARQEASLGEPSKMSLAIGGLASLWDILLQSWIHALAREFPDVSLQAETDSIDAQIRKLRDGALDVGFMYEPPQVAELVARRVATIQLVMVSSRPEQRAHEAIGAGYVMVDWGTTFGIAHARHFPDISPPHLRVGLGRMGLAYLLECGGAAYLARRMAAEHIAAGRLFAVADAPEIDRTVYAVWDAANERRVLLERALQFIPPPPDAAEAAPAAVA
jgi:DNA-binding transcriptional LysR family regulator